MRSAFFTAVFCLLVALPNGRAAGPSVDAFLQRYCLDCHSVENAKGDVALEALHGTGFGTDPWLWKLVREQIASEEMPPEEPLPDFAARQRILEHIDAGLAKIDWSLHPAERSSPASIARLTRTEYRNTVRDLFGIDLRAGTILPVDGEGASGFDNDRAALALTPALMATFFDEAERVVDAVLALENEAFVQSFSAQQMIRQAGHEKVDPKGAAILVHPGDRIQAEMNFPVSGYYRFTIAARNLGKPPVIDVAIGGRVVAAASVSSKEISRVNALGYVTAGRQLVTLRSRNLVPQVPLPGDVNPRVLRLAEKKAARFPAESSAQESSEVSTARQVLHQRSVAVQEAYEWLRLLGPGADPREIDRFRRYAKEREHGVSTAKDRLAGELGIPRAAFDEIWKSVNAEVLSEQSELLDAVAGVNWSDWQNHQGTLIVQGMECAGPVHPRGKAGVMSDLRNSEGGLSPNFLKRAFRRPVTEADTHRYELLERNALAAGLPQEEALRLTAVAVLVSPDFLLHRSVVGSDKEQGRGFAFASRLSYFLWQSMPDEELFAAAASGEIFDPVVIGVQVERMLNDSRADAFFASFTSQWLGLDQLGRGVGADRNRFPEFTPQLALTMKGEATRWVREVFRNDRDTIELVDSRETFLNEPLARLYGIEGVAGDAWRKVSLTDHRRGGVLGMAAVLTATSAPTRAHPSRRGTWVLENLLGLQQGEPLADAGELPGDAGEGRGLTLRDELDLHRNRAECASCHDIIDPVGLGLQSFDALGRWRQLEAGEPIDDRGRLPDGEEFDGPVGLKKALVERRQQFTRNLSARLLSYAIGRKLRPVDETEIEQIAGLVREADGSAHALLKAIVNSPVFQGGAE